MPAAIICSGSTPKQRVEVTTVENLEKTIKEKALEPPGIMVVGTVASLREVLGDLQ
jgi:siroheme synthase